MPGHEVIGLIDAIGSGVAGWTVGQRVGRRLSRRQLRLLQSLPHGDATNGTLMVIGLTEAIEVSPALLIRGRRSVKGWYSGTSIDSQDTLAFAASSGVRSMNEVFPLERAADAYRHMESGRARFRVVLTTGN